MSIFWFLVLVTNVCIFLLVYYYVDRPLFRKGTLITHYSSNNIEHPDPGAIVELNDQTLYDLIITKQKPAFVLYYEPSCRECKDFLEPYSNMAESIASETNMRNQKLMHQLYPQIIFCAIDCLQFGNVCAQHLTPLLSFPSLFAYNFGKI